MSEPPDPPPTLDYGLYERGGLPTGVQAFFGALVTLIITGGATFAMGFVTLTGSDRSKDPGSVILEFVFAGIVLFGGLLAYANYLKRSPDKRGWAIGIYVGLLLGFLFYGFCGVMVASSVPI